MSQHRCVLCKLPVRHDEEVSTLHTKRYVPNFKQTGAAAKTHLQTQLKIHDMAL